MTTRSLAAAMLNLAVAIACGGVTSTSDSGETPDPASASDATQGGTDASAVTLSETNGTCAAPFEFPLSDDAWWQADWTRSSERLPLGDCGDANNPDLAPAVVAKWSAPHDGQYFAYGWSRDFNGVFTGSPRCGIQGSGGCALLIEQNVPDPPWDVRAVAGSGFNFYAKAGEVWFFWFQYLDLDGAPAPDDGVVISNVTFVSP